MGVELELAGDLLENLQIQIMEVLEEVLAGNKEIVERVKMTRISIFPSKELNDPSC